MSKVEIKNISKLLSGKTKLLVKDVHGILGFSRVDNFQRFLRNEKYNNGVVYDYDIKRPTWIKLPLFFDLVHKRLGWNDEWERIFTEVWTNYYKAEIIRFTKSNHKSDYRHGFLIGNKVAGKYYMYSLTTKNLAESNDLCPYEVYKHCATKYVSYRDGKMWHLSYDHTIPFMSFDRPTHAGRYAFIAYLTQFIKEFELSELQQKRITIYGKVVKEMLMMQAEIDEKKEARKKKLEKKLFGELLSPQEKSELKKLYRKAAFLCHPDVTKGSDEMFKKVNKAYKENKLTSLRRLYNDLN